MSKYFNDYVHGLYSEKYMTMNEMFGDNEYSCQCNLDIDGYTRDVAHQIAERVDDALIDNMLKEPAITSKLHDRGWYYIGNQDD